MSVQTHVNTPQEPAGSVPGWFERQRTRLFGKRDPVEAQLHDLERQGTFGARISHVFAGFLIVLFSAASLIALGADSVRAVLRSIAANTLDIPNTVATGVTGLLVPCMDVAILRAASKIRILATRRATRSELALHIGVVAGISIIEACTYCYMSAIYQHPSGGADWALIAARAFAAPLIGVYLAMDRPHPVTSRDILAQVELGAGAGVIRDVTVIANDADASLDRKMELFGASAVMREHERERLESLITVARKHSGNALPAPRAIVRASRTLPLTETLEHHAVAASAYKELHDGTDYEPTDPWACGNNNEVADEVYDEDADTDIGGWRTSVTNRDDLVSDDPSASDTKHLNPRARVQSNSGARRTHQQASKTMRETHKKMRLDAKQARKRLVRECAYAIFDELAITGEQPRYGAIGKQVGKSLHLETAPSANTIQRLWGTWKASRTHKALLDVTSDEVEPIQPVDVPELRELQEVLS